MKHWFRYVMTGVPTVALLLAGCDNKKQEEAKAPDGEPAAAAAPAEQPDAKPAQPSPAAALSAADRVAKLGFVKRLPADTESVVAMYQGNEMFRRLKELKLWKFIAEQEAFGDIEGEIEDLAGAGEEGEVTPGLVLGEEIFLATGPGAGEQLGNLIRLNNRSTHFQMRNLVKMLATQISGEDAEGADPMMGMGMGMMGSFGDLLKDPESGIALFEKMSMPSVLVGIKVSDKDQREALAQQIASGLEMIGGDVEFVEPVSFEREGAKFSGSRILGAKLAEMMDAEKEDMGDMLDPADVERLIKAVAKKNIVVASGVLDEYVLIFTGTSEEQFHLAASVDKSLGGSAGFSFMDEYAGKEIVGLTYGAGNLMKAVSKESGGLKSLVGGIREGLAGTKVFGDTRDIEALLQVVVEREGALLATMKCSTLGLVAFLEDGFKLESIGGCGYPDSIDSTTPHALSGLGAGEDVLLFADSVSNPEYNELTRGYLEAIAETAYAMAEKASTMEQLDDPEFEQFRSGFQMFDTEFRPHAVKIWDALSGSFFEGVGSESALVIDMSGSVPPIPGIPQELVDEGKAPRISLVCPVVDRAKIAASWKDIDLAGRELLKVVGEMQDEEIPMPKPMSSENNGLKTWFFSAPFFTDDFMPSVTLSDKWFVASTSKTRAVDLVKQIDGKGPQRTGAWMRFDFDALRKFSSEWLVLADKHGDVIFKDNEAELEDFRANRKLIEDGIQAASEFDEINLHGRYVDGRLRFSLHFKIR